MRYTSEQNHYYEYSQLEKAEHVLKEYSLYLYNNSHDKLVQDFSSVLCTRQSET